MRPKKILLSNGSMVDMRENKAFLVVNLLVCSLINIYYENFHTHIKEEILNDAPRTQHPASTVIYTWLV